MVCPKFPTGHPLGAFQDSLVGGDHKIESVVTEVGGLFGGGGRCIGILAFAKALRPGLGCCCGALAAWTQHGVSLALALSPCQGLATLVSGTQVLGL